MTDENPHRIVADAAGAVDQTRRNQSIAPVQRQQSEFAKKIHWALAYASLGFRVFPLHSIRDGRCTCSRADCGKNSGKHPRVKDGFKVATADALLIEAWWRKWQDANIGIATGATSGIVVLDIDGSKGLESLRLLEAKLGPLPLVPTVQTARGVHRYFKYAPGEIIRCSTGDGLDVRGDGGYAVAPPSNHLSGHTYRWIGHAF
jgi:putative DNA primase/helicase